MNIKIGEKIKQLRQRDGRKQEDLANALGVTCQAISRWEANGGYPDMELIPAIANYFNVSIDELLKVMDITTITASLSNKELENIFKELKNDLGYPRPQTGNLTKWAQEGVLLMNTSLSVREHQANSHSKCGWAWFTDSVIELISREKQNVVFILWGGNARSKKALIDKRHKANLFKLELMPIFDPFIETKA